MCFDLASHTTSDFWHQQSFNKQRRWCWSCRLWCSLVNADWSAWCCTGPTEGVFLIYKSLNLLFPFLLAVAGLMPSVLSRYPHVTAHLKISAPHSWDCAGASFRFHRNSFNFLSASGSWAISYSLRHKCLTSADLFSVCTLEKVKMCQRSALFQQAQLSWDWVRVSPHLLIRFGDSVCFASPKFMPMCL